MGFEGLKVRKSGVPGSEASFPDHECDVVYNDVFTRITDCCGSKLHHSS